MTEINICFPYILNPTGGSFVSAKLLAENFGDELSSQFVFGMDGSAVTRAKTSGLNTQVLDLGESLSNRINSDTRIFEEVVIGTLLIPYLRKVREFLKSESVDIVHVNDGLTAMIWGAASKTTGSTVIWHVRGEQTNEWDPLRVKLCDYLIFVSKSNKQRFSPAKLNEIPTSIVYNGVDTDRFSPGDSTYIHKELNISPEKPIIGFVGNLVARKRPMLFIESAIEVLNLNENIHFIVVGEDQGGYTEKINRTVRREGFTNNVHFMGYRSDINKIMPSLTLLVLTSKEHGEAFPRVPLEAMACGTPVVTTDTAGVSEAVINDETGVVLETDPTPEQIGDTISDLITDRERLEQFSAKGITRIEHEFTATQTANSVSRIYKRLL